jgi:hypothetical protein
MSKPVTTHPGPEWGSTAGDSAGQLVELLDFGTRCGNASVTLEGAWEISGLAFSVGPHSLVAKIDDSESAPFIFEVEPLEEREDFEGESDIDFASTEYRDVGTFVLMNGFDALGSGIRNFKGMNGYPLGPTAYLSTEYASYRVEIAFKKRYSRIRCRITTPEARSHSADAFFINGQGAIVHIVPINSQSRVLEIDYAVPDEAYISTLAFQANGTDIRNYFVTMDDFILTVTQ